MADEMPHTIESLLDLTASLASSVVSDAQLNHGEVAKIAALFEMHADFCWSVAEWMRVRDEDFSTPTKRNAQAEPLPSGVEELYRPWKPYRLIDEVLERGGAGRVVALKVVRARECHDADDFPDEPMSAAMLLEALGHAAVIAIKEGTPEGSPPLPASVSVRFSRPVHAGDKVILTCEVKKRRLGFCLVDGVASLDDAPVLTAQFRFRTQQVRVPSTAVT